MIKILGIDPGLGRIGFGLVNSEKRNHCQALGWGLIETTPKAPMGQRLVELYNDMTQLLQQSQPDVMAIESYFYFRNNTTIISVAQARGIILLSAEQANLEVIEYTPMQVKQCLTGYGKADKKEVLEAVMQRLALNKKPTPDDAADGLAIALTHLQYNNT